MSITSPQNVYTIYVQYVIWNPFPPTLLPYEKFILIEIENKQNNYHLTRRLTFKM